MNFVCWTCRFLHPYSRELLVRAWTNEKCLATKHHQTLFCDQTQIKQLIQAAEQAWYACLDQTCLIRGCPNEQNIAHQTREQKKCSKFSIECLMALKLLSNTTKHDQTRSNTIKHDQTASNKVSKR